jgi:signal transduction histidine kinase
MLYADRDGRKIPVSFSGSVILDERGEVEGIVCVAKDITERKRAEEALEVANTQLQEIVQLAENASRHKSEFLSNMSHELRTPLNSVLGFSQLLETQTAGPLTEKQARYVNNILGSGRHLLTLINDILDLSKVEAGKVELQPEPFALPEALAEALTEIRPQATAKRVEFQLEMNNAPPLVTADPVRFKQILLNLLSNAVKFTPDGGRVTVSARPPQDGFVEIAVADTGIGIKAEDIPRLFQPFTQLEAASTKQYQGTGLGLALTKKLVELHGGTIAVGSEGAGKGTTFTVRLPLAISA